MIGMVGSAAAVDELSAAATDVATTRGDGSAVLEADPDVVVAVGERAVIDLAGEFPRCPVLPVDAGPGLDAIDLRTAAGSMARLSCGDFDTRSRPILGVRLGDEFVGVAVFDVMLVTSEPARISEFSLTAEAPVDQFRADGLVAATPAGSAGYAKTAGGPVVDSGSDVLTIVPVAAFTTRTGQWVLDPPISIEIERNEGEISLLLDDRIHGTVQNDLPVNIEVEGRLDTVSIDG